MPLTTRSERAATRALLILAIAGIGSCGYWTLEPSDVLSDIEVTATPSSPRVGETTFIEATPVDGDGAPMAGIDCRYLSSNAGDLSLNPAEGPSTTGTALDTGTVTVTVRCWSKSKTFEVIVRPAL